MNLDEGISEEKYIAYTIQFNGSYTRYFKLKGERSLVTKGFRGSDYKDGIDFRRQSDL